MSWYQENWLGILFVIGMVIMLFRGPVLAWVFKVRHISTHELAALLGSKEPPVLLDVRTPMEYQAGHVPNSVLLPLQQMGRIRSQEIRDQYPNRAFAVICRSGSRSVLAAVNLRRVGVTQVYNVVGGINAWHMQGYPVQK